MIFCIVVVLAAFYWLMHETEWLTLRLPFGEPSIEVELDVGELIAISVCVVVGLALVKYLVDDTSKIQMEEGK